MGYRIDYAGPIPVRNLRDNTGIRVRSLIAATFLIFSILVRMLWPAGTARLQAVFLPNTLSITEQAFSQMLADLHQGMTLGDSVTIFCHRIVDAAS